MARPTRKTKDGTARKRMSEAFWTCMGEEPYDKLTVARIVREAGVNRNSFYYHFEDIDSMARTVVVELLDKDFLKRVLARFHGQDTLLDTSPNSDLSTRLDRMCLIASDNSSVALQKILRDAMSEIWCDTFGITLETLTLPDRLAFEYNLGGIFSLLAYRANASNNFMIEDVASADFAKNIMESMEVISKKQKAKDG